MKVGTILKILGLLFLIDLINKFVPVDWHWLWGQVENLLR